MVHNIGLFYVQDVPICRHINRGGVKTPNGCVLLLPNYLEQLVYFSVTERCNTIYSQWIIMINASFHSTPASASFWWKYIEFKFRENQVRTESSIKLEVTAWLCTNDTNHAVFQWDIFMCWFYGCYHGRYTLYNHTVFEWDTFLCWFHGCYHGRCTT